MKGKVTFHVSDVLEFCGLVSQDANTGSWLTVVPVRRWRVRQSETCAVRGFMKHTPFCLVKLLWLQWPGQGILILRWPSVQGRSDDNFWQMFFLIERQIDTALVVKCRSFLRSCEYKSAGAPLEEFNYFGTNVFCTHEPTLPLQIWHKFQLQLCDEMVKGLNCYCVSFMSVISQEWIEGFLWN